MSSPTHPHGLNVVPTNRLVDSDTVMDPSERTEREEVPATVPESNLQGPQPLTHIGHNHQFVQQHPLGVMRDVPGLNISTSVHPLSFDGGMLPSPTTPATPRASHRVRRKMSIFSSEDEPTEEQEQRTPKDHNESHHTLDHMLETHRHLFGADFQPDEQGASHRFDPSLGVEHSDQKGMSTHAGASS